MHHRDDPDSFFFTLLMVRTISTHPCLICLAQTDEQQTHGTAVKRTHGAVSAAFKAPRQGKKKHHLIIKSKKRATGRWDRKNFAETEYSKTLNHVSPHCAY